MFGFRDDLPAGALALMPGFFLLLAAGFVYVGPLRRPAPYHGLLTVHGTVTEVVDTGSGVLVSVDTLGGAAPPAQVHVTDPQLDTARTRMLALPLGESVAVQFDPITSVAWRLRRGDAKPGFGDDDISHWQAAAGATAHRRGEWLLGAAVVAILLGLVIMSRSDDAKDPLDFSPRPDRSLMP